MRDVSSEIIDFHSHILPSADHGSDGMNTSIGQIALMNSAGVDTAVLTPHFYPNRHRVDDFCSKVSSAAEELISGCGRRPRFCLGAEVLYCDRIEKMEQLEKLCVRGTDILLLELPMSDVWSRKMLPEIRHLASRYTVVIAHIDRYAAYHAEELELLLEYGALAQINASALFRVSTRRNISSFLDSGQICALGSDLHGVDKRVSNQFAKAQKRLGDEYCAIMNRAARLLKNAEKI